MINFLVNPYTQFIVQLILILIFGYFMYEGEM